MKHQPLLRPKKVYKEPDYKQLLYEARQYNKELQAQNALLKRFARDFIAAIADIRDAKKPLPIIKRYLSKADKLIKKGTI